MVKNRLSNLHVRSVYNVTAAILSDFDNSDIEYVLYRGSHLAARRHGHNMKWDKDVDILVIGTQERIESSLRRSVPKAWVPQRDGLGYAIGGSKQRIDGYYVDIWVYKIEEQKVFCYGIRGSCAHWYSHNRHHLPPRHPISFIRPSRVVKFGPIFAKIPVSDGMLNTYYKNWKTKCGPHACTEVEKKYIRTMVLTHKTNRSV